MKRVMTSFVVALSMILVLFGNMGQLHAEDEESVKLNKNDSTTLYYYFDDQAQENFKFVSEDDSIVSCDETRYMMGSDYTYHLECKVEYVNVGNTHVYLKDSNGKIVKTYNIKCTRYNQEICPCQTTTITMSSSINQDYSVIDNGKIVDGIPQHFSLTFTSSGIVYNQNFEFTYYDEGEHDLYFIGSMGSNTSYVLNVAHEWNNDYSIDQQPTCTSEGSKSIHCRRCGQIKEGTTTKIAKLPHEWNKDYTIDQAATCTNAGEKSIHCKNCNTIKEGSKVTIPALGHNYGDWKSINDQQHQRVCKNDSSHVEKADHHFDEGKITTEPTYTKEGIKTYTCKDCGYTKTEKLAIKPHTHNYKEEITKQPTCTAQGVKTYTCPICGDSYTKDIPALGHNYGEWTKADDKQHQCVCKNDSSHVEKEDHKWDQGKVTKQPTCTDQGIKTFTCSICGGSYTQAIPALGHNYGEWTKADDKQHQRVCKNDSTHVEKEDHKWDQGKVTKAATTDTEGVKTYTCTVCHATKEEKIAKLPAVKKNEPKTQATNTSAVSEKKEAAAQTKENTAKQPQPMTKNQDAKLATKASPKVQFSTTQVIDRKVTTLKGDRDISGSQFGLLQAKANKVTKSSIKVQWKKIKGAKGYIIYGNKCGKKYQKLTSVKGLFWTQRKLKKGTYYKYMVVAYNGKGKAIAYSKTIHVTTLGGKKVNPTNVKLKSPKKLTLKVKKKAQIKASYVLAKKAKMSNHRGLAYESSNTKVASVSKKGQITAKKKGVCTIYVYGQNGSMNKIQVKVQ